MSAPPGSEPADRHVPGNEHIWKELEALIGQVRAFKDRLQERRARYLAGATDCQEAADKCDRMLAELATLNTRKELAT